MSKKYTDDLLKQGKGPMKAAKAVPSIQETVAANKNKKPVNNGNIYDVTGNTWGSTSKKTKSGKTFTPKNAGNTVYPGAKYNTNKGSSKSKDNAKSEPKQTVEKKPSFYESYVANKDKVSDTQQQNSRFIPNKLNQNRFAAGTAADQPKFTPKFTKPGENVFSQPRFIPNKTKNSQYWDDDTIAYLAYQSKNPPAKLSMQNVPKTDPKTNRKINAENLANGSVKLYDDKYGYERDNNAEYIQIGMSSFNKLDSGEYDSAIDNTRNSTPFALSPATSDGTKGYRFKDNLTSEEKYNYYYLVGQMGNKEADAYLDKIHDNVIERARKKNIEKEAKSVGQLVPLASAAIEPMITIGQSAEGAVAFGKKLLGKDVTSRDVSVGVFGDAMNEGVQESYAHKLIDKHHILANTVHGIAHNLPEMLLNATGAGRGFSIALGALDNMGGKAAKMVRNGTINDKYAGLDLLVEGGIGALEWGFIGKGFNKIAKNITKTMPASMAKKLIEDAFSTTLSGAGIGAAQHEVSMAADALLMGKNSDYIQTAQAYEAMGYKNAYPKAFIDIFLKGAGNAALVGGVTGALMALPGTTSGMFDYHVRGKELVKQGYTADDIINETLNFSRDSEAYKSAEVLKAYINGGNKVNDDMLGALSVLNNIEMARISNDIAEISRLTGVPIEPADMPEQYNGMYKDGKIYINRRADADAIKTVWHELSHAMDDAGINGSKEVPGYIKSLIENTGFASAMNEYRFGYEAQNKPYNDDLLAAEVAADFARNFTLDSKGIARLAKMAEGNSVFYNKLRGSLDWLTKRLDRRGGKTFYDETTKMTVTRQELREMQELFNQALPKLRDAKFGNSERYSVKYDAENKPYIVIDEDILDGVPKEDWKKTVRDVMRDKYSGRIDTETDTYRVNAKSRNEYTHSNYSQKINEALRVDKFRMANNLDEILRNQHQIKSEDLKHIRNDSFIRFEHGDAVIKVGRNDYTADVVVGITKGGNKVFYDIVKLEPTKITGHDAASRAAQEGSSYYTHTMPGDGHDVALSAAQEGSTDYTHIMPGGSENTATNDIVPQRGGNVNGEIDTSGAMYSSREMSDAEVYGFSIAENAEKYYTYSGQKYVKNQYEANKGILHQAIRDAYKRYYSGDIDGGYSKLAQAAEIAETAAKHPNEFSRGGFISYFVDKIRSGMIYNASKASDARSVADMQEYNIAVSRYLNNLQSSEGVTQTASGRDHNRYENDIRNAFGMMKRGANEPDVREQLRPVAEYLVKNGTITDLDTGAVSKRYTGDTGAAVDDLISNIINHYKMEQRASSSTEATIYTRDMAKYGENIEGQFRNAAYGLKERQVKGISETVRETIDTITDGTDELTQADLYDVVNRTATELLRGTKDKELLGKVTAEMYRVIYNTSDVIISKRRAAAQDILSRETAAGRRNSQAGLTAQEELRRCMDQARVYNRFGSASKTDVSNVLKRTGIKAPWGSGFQGELLSREAEFTYLVAGNQQTYESACRVYAQYDNETLMNMLANKEAWSAIDTTVANLVTADYSRIGDNRRAVDMLSITRAHHTKAGQSTQAQRLIQYLTPEGRLTLLSDERIKQTERLIRAMHPENADTLVKQFHDAVTKEKERQRNLEERHMKVDPGYREKVETLKHDKQVAIDVNKQLAMTKREIDHAVKKLSESGNKANILANLRKNARRLAMKDAAPLKGDPEAYKKAVEEISYKYLERVVRKMSDYEKENKILPSEELVNSVHDRITDNIRNTAINQFVDEDYTIDHRSDEYKQQYESIINDEVERVKGLLSGNDKKISFKEFLANVDLDKFYGEQYEAGYSTQEADDYLVRYYLLKSNPEINDDLMDGFYEVINEPYKQFSNKYNDSKFFSPKQFAASIDKLQNTVPRLKIGLDQHRFDHFVSAEVSAEDIFTSSKKFAKHWDKINFDTVENKQKYLDLLREYEKYNNRLKWYRNRMAEALHRARSRAAADYKEKGTIFSSFSDIENYYEGIMRSERIADYQRRLIPLDEEEYDHLVERKNLLKEKAAAKGVSERRKKAIDAAVKRLDEILDDSNKAKNDTAWVEKISSFRKFDEAYIEKLRQAESAHYTYNHDLPDISVSDENVNNLFDSFIDAYDNVRRPSELDNDIPTDYNSVYSSQRRSMRWKDLDDVPDKFTDLTDSVTDAETEKVIADYFNALKKDTELEMKAKVLFTKIKSTEMQLNLEHSGFVNNLLANGEIDRPGIYTDTLLSELGIRSVKQADMEFFMELLHIANDFTAKDENGEYILSDETVIDFIMRASDKRGTAKQVLDRIAPRTDELGTVTEYHNGMLKKALTSQLKKMGREHFKAIATEQVFGFLDDAQPRPIGKKLRTLQFEVQLNNGSTASRNVFSTSAFHLTEALTNNIAYFLDTVASVFTKQKTVGLQNPFSKEGFKAGWNRGQQAYLESALNVDIIGINPETTVRTGRKRTFVPNGRASSFLAMMERNMGYILSVPDEFHKGMIAQQLEDGFRNIKKNFGFTDEEMMKIIEQEIQYRTFNDKTKIGTALQDAQQSLNNLFGISPDKDGNNVFGLGNFITPYTYVPGAVLTRSIEYSPLAGIRAIADIADMAQQYHRQKQGVNATENYRVRFGNKNDADTGTLTQPRRMNAQQQRKLMFDLARPLTGSLLVALAYGLRKNGIIVGFSDDDEDDYKKGQYAKTKGLSKFQLNLSAIKRLVTTGHIDGTQKGDTFMGLEWLTPINSLMSIGAAAADMIGDHAGEMLPGDYFQYGMRASLDNLPKQFTDMSMFTTIYNLVRNWQNTESFGEFASASTMDFALTFYPSFLNQIGNVRDDKVRNPYYGDSIWDIGMNKLLAKLPFMSARDKVPVKVDMFGNAVSSTTGSFVGDILENMILPGSLSTYKEDDFTTEIDRLSKYSHDVLPRTAYRSYKWFVDDNPNLQAQFKLNDADYQDFQTLLGQTAKNNMLAFMQSDDYKYLNDAQRVKQLEDISRYTTYTVRDAWYAMQMGAPVSEIQKKFQEDIDKYAKAAADMVIQAQATNYLAQDGVKIEDVVDAGKYVPYTEAEKAEQLDTYKDYVRKIKNGTFYLSDMGGKSAYWSKKDRDLKIKEYENKIRDIESGAKGKWVTFTGAYNDLSDEDKEVIQNKLKYNPEQFHLPDSVRNNKQVIKSSDVSVTDITGKISSDKAQEILKAMGYDVSGIEKKGSGNSALLSDIRDAVLESKSAESSGTQTAKKSNSSKRNWKTYSGKKYRYKKRYYKKHRYRKYKRYYKKKYYSKKRNYYSYYKKYNKNYNSGTGSSRFVAGKNQSRFKSRFNAGGSRFKPRFVPNASNAAAMQYGNAANDSKYRFIPNGGKNSNVY